MTATIITLFSAFISGRTCYNNTVVKTPEVNTVICEKRIDTETKVQAKVYFYVKEQRRERKRENIYKCNKDMKCN